MLNDDGDSDSDLLTTDARLTGSVDATSGQLVVEFDHDGDGLAEDLVATELEGVFNYTPLELAFGGVTIQARAGRWDANLSAYNYGDWTSIAFTYQAPSNLPPELSVGLQSDTGVSSTDGVTAAPTLTGAVSDDVNPGFLTVEFDHAADGTVDGTTTSEADGSFTYVPSGLTAGQITVNVRATEWDAHQEITLYGDWVAFTFTYDDTANAAPVVASLALANDTGDFDDDGVTTDPSFAGSVTNDGLVTGLLVQLDFDGDALSDATVTTDAEGNFSHAPEGLALGSATIQARAREWDPAQQEFVFGDWTSLTFTLEEEAVEPLAIAAFALLSDSGTSSSDGITANATVAGQLTGDGSLEGVMIEFDHDSDGVADGTGFSDPDGEFLYAPQAISFGSITIQARAKRWDVDQEVFSTTAWNSLTFTYEDQANLAPVMAEFTIANDTGVSDSDGITGDTTLTGRIINEGALSGQTVEFDLDADGTSDCSTTTDAQGTFTYAPTGLTVGSVTVSARTRELDESTNTYLVGSWTSLTFTYQMDANAAAELASWGLLNDTGDSDADNVTCDATLTGTVSNDGQVGSLIVEFDHDGDTVVDGVTTTDSGGTFTYLPDNLIVGTVNVSARVKEWTGSEHLYSNWETFSFTLKESPDAPLRVSQLALANDTGASATDLSTSDSQLSGQLAGENLEGVTVEFDHDGDGFADGSVVTDATGAFIYTPADLPDGRNTIQARSVHAAGGLLGDWTGVSFILSDDPDGAEAQAQAAALDGFDSAMQAAQTSYENSVATADGTYDSVIDAAATTYQGATAQAQSDQDVAESTAEATLVSAVASADAAYTTSMDAAATAYATAMAGYSGDATSYAAYGMVDGFAWPDAPGTSGAPQPSTPGPGMPLEIAAQAAYQGMLNGPQFDPYSDPNYQSTLAAELDSYLAAVAAARTQYDDAIALAGSDYDAGVSAAATTKGISDAAAQALFESTINGYANPIDLAQAQQDYSAALAQAQTDYEDTLATLSTVLQQALLTAQGEHSSRVEAANTTYAETMDTVTTTFNEAVGAAWSQYYVALEAYNEEAQRIDMWEALAEMVHTMDPSAPAPPHADITAARAANEANLEAAAVIRDTACDAAWTVFRNDAADASYTLAIAEADSEETLATDGADAAETHGMGEAGALNAKIVAEQSAWLVKRNAEIGHSSNEYDVKARAIQVREDAFAMATKVEECAVALARKAKDVASAAAEKALTTAMGQANAAYTIAMANSRKTAATAWAAAQGTHWATYQEALVANEADYNIDVTNANLAFTTDRAAAAEVRAAAQAEAQRVYAEAAASARLKHAMAKNAAVKAFKVGGGAAPAGYLAAMTAYKLDVATNRKDQQQTYETAEPTYLTAVTPMQHTLAIDLAAARHTSASAQAAARRDREKEVIDQTGYDSAMETAASVLGWDRYHAHEMYYGGTGGAGGEYAASETKAAARVDANKYFRDALTAAESVLLSAQSGIAGDVEQDMALADTNRTSDYRSAATARDNSKLAAGLAYVTTVSAAEAVKTSATTWAGAAADQADIQDWATFVSAEASDYYSAVDAWANAAGTPWAAYQAELAAAWRAGVVARANAEVAAVTRDSTADATWIASLATSAAAWTTGTAGAEVSRESAVKTAEVTRTNADATAELLMMTSVSNAVTTYDDTVASFNKTFKNAESAHNQAVENAADLAWWAKKATDLVVTLNPLLYVADRMAGEDLGPHLRASETAMRAYRASVEAPAAKALAEERRDWTFVGVAPAKEQLVQSLGAANKTAVESMADNEQAFIDAVASAKKAFAYNMAGTNSTFELARAGAEKVVEHARADSNELASQDYATADAAEEVARAEAKKNFDIARANLHATDVSDWAIAEGTHYADYIAALAAADAVWTATVAPARVAYVTSMTTADVAWTNQLAAADKAWAHCRANAEHARVVAMNPADKLAQEKTADAAETQTKANSAANMTFKKAMIAADEIYNNAVAAAQRLLAEANAVAGVIFVDAAADIKAHQFTYNETVEQYNADVDSDLQAYSSTLRANNITRQTTIADALVTWTSSMAAAEKACGITAATASRDFTVEVQALTDAFAASKKTAADAKTSDLAGGKSARITAVATAYSNWVTATSTADTVFVQAGGAASVTWNTDTAAAEAGYHVAMANDAAAAAQNWANAEGTPQAHFYADMAAAHAAWVADVAPDYVTFRTDSATAGAARDYAVAVADADRATTEEAATLAYYTNLAPDYATRKTTVGAADTALEKSKVVKGNAHMVAVANANLVSVTTTATAQESHANAMAMARRNYDVGILIDPGTGQALQETREQDEADSVLVVKTAETDARLAWTTTVSTADATYATDMADAEQTHAVGVATAKETYADAYSTQRSTWYQATVVAGVTRAKDVADAEYDFAVATAQAFSTALVAQYDARAAAMLSFVSYNLPWLNFQIALASHEAAWISAIAPDYVAFESAVAGADKTYLYAEADAYGVRETAIDAAVASYDTTVNDAWLASALAQAGAQKTHVTAMAPLQAAYDQARAHAKRDYTVAVATADRNLVHETITQEEYDNIVSAAGTAQSNALQAAMSVYRLVASVAESVRLVSLAGTSKTYAIARADASLAYTTSAVGAVETYVITVSNAGVVCQTTVANESCDYWILATDSYADEMYQMAAASPWGAQYYASARAEADRVALVAPAQRDRQIAAADAARDYTQNEAAAEKEKVLDKAQASHDWAVAMANAQYARVLLEAAAVVADGDYSPPRLDTPASGNATIVSAGMALNGEPTDFALQNGYSDLFNSVSDGWMGDGYYMGIVSGMFHVAPARDELGYTNGFHRALGENLIRPVLSDTVLINATGTQIIVGTVLACAAVPLAVFFAPAIIAAAPGLFVMSIVSGAAIGAAYNVGGQLQAGATWSTLDWSSVGASALLGGALGAGSFVAFGFLAASIPGFCTFATLAGFAGGGYSIYHGANEILDGNYYTGALDLVIGFTGVYGASRGWFGRASRAMGGTCFVLGTQVVRHAVAVELASRCRTSEDVSSAWRPELLGLAAGTFFAGLLIAPDAAERRRREEEAKRARHLMFDRAEDAAPWQDDWDDLAEATAVPDTSPPDPWAVEIDSLCDALFNGPVEEPGVDAELDADCEFDLQPAFEPASEGCSPGMAFPRRETAVALEEPPVRLERKRSAATLPRRAPIPPKSKSTRRTLRWLLMAACFLLSGLFFLKASPPESLLPGDLSSSIAPTASAESRQKYVTSNIEDIRVGDRVLGRNPELTDAERAVPDPDPVTWRRLELRAPKRDGTWADVVLLRSVIWLEEREVKLGGTVRISVPECSIEGNAEVLSIGDCPPIEPGTGPVVTGTFRHASGHVMDLYVEGLADPIGTTANHPFWSETRQAFVRADELEIGDCLRLPAGTAHVKAVIPRARPEAVYNLEVQTEHVYHVSTAGVLVHNGSAVWCPKSQRWRNAKNGRYTKGPGSSPTGQTHHPISAKVGRALNNHPNLKGHFQPHDPRFTTRAIDGQSHRGYERWHRDLDDNIVRWIESNPNATPDDFLNNLRNIYKCPSMSERFPDGF